VDGEVSERVAASINFEGHSARVESPQAKAWPGSI